MRKSQEGFLNFLALGPGLVKLLVVLAIVAAVGGIVYAVRSYIETRDEAIFTSGILTERSRWQEREASELAAANRKILELTTKIRKLESDHAAAITKLSDEYQLALDEARIRHDLDLARVASGDLVLRDRGRTASCKGAGTGGGAKAGTAAGQADAAKGAELSKEATGFLLSLAREADEVVVQLTKLQEAFRTYMRSCEAVR